jgi:hypothetical protein
VSVVNDSSVKGRGSPWILVVRWAWMAEDNCGWVVDRGLGGMDIFIIRREVVVGVMPKRRNDSAIFEGVSGLWERECMMR